MNVTGIISLISVAAFVLIVTWLSFQADRKFRRELAERTPLDDDQFFQAYYDGTEVEPDIPRRLRPIYCKFFDIDVTKLRPLDRPPEICEIDTSELVQDVEAEFAIKIPDRDAEQIDGSFDSIVRYIASQRRQPDSRE